MEQKYPEYFPQGCPPADAERGEKELYRSCEGITTEKSDFVSYYIKDPQKNKNDVRFYGLSVFGSIDDCMSAYRKSQRIFGKYRSISKVGTNIERGSYKKTPTKMHPAHITWWVCEGVQPETFFETVRIMENENNE